MNKWIKLAMLVTLFISASGLMALAVVEHKILPAILAAVFAIYYTDAFVSKKGGQDESKG